ncbi:MAG TPA: hypothetical protein VHR18_10505 [Solirubrobacterales bacterium]|jgi:hypothetical protein|nr:hypothetical protein [Solirubrobacterales bacterium]
MPSFAVKSLMEIEPGGNDQLETRFARKHLDSERRPEDGDGAIAKDRWPAP